MTARTYTVDEVRAMLREHIERRYGSQAEAARQWNVSSVLVTRMVNGSKAPNPTVLAELGLTRVVTYREVDA